MAIFPKCGFQTRFLLNTFERIYFSLNPLKQGRYTKEHKVSCLIFNVSIDFFPLFLLYYMNTFIELKGIKQNN